MELPSSLAGVDLLWFLPMQVMATGERERETKVRLLFFGGEMDNGCRLQIGLVLVLTICYCCFPISSDKQQPMLLFLNTFP